MFYKILKETNIRRIKPDLRWSLAVLHRKPRERRECSVVSFIPSLSNSVSVSQVLSLANNQLSSLPASLSNLTRLRKLNLSHNHIAHIPGCVYNMKALVCSHQSDESKCPDFIALTDFKYYTPSEMVGRQSNSFGNPLPPTFPTLDLGDCV